MAVSNIDIEVFKDIPLGVQCSLASLTERRGLKGRIDRLVKLNMVKRLDAPNEHIFMKIDVTDECCKCGWIGHENSLERVEAMAYAPTRAWNNVCPECGCHETYRLV